MSYTNKGTIQNYLMIDIDNSFDTQISNWITAVENYINNYTGRPDGFEIGTASDKYFDGSGKTEINIDPFTSLVTVQILEANGADVEYTLTEGQDNDYLVYPYNDTPKYRLILTTNAQVANWYKGKKRIKINAIWGYKTTVPKDIELIATKLVSRIVEKGYRGGKVIAEALGDYSVTYADINEEAEAMGIIDTLDLYKLLEL